MKSSHRVAAGVVFVCVFLLHVFLLPQQGLTDDDDFYAPAGIRYAGWVGDVFTQPSTALSQNAIDGAFTLNHEHPPFAKLVFGLSHAVWHRGLGVLGSLDGARAGNALFAAVLAATLILWLWRRAGVVVAGGSVLALLSLPRFFFHSEVATLDVPVSAMIVLTTALFSWSLERESWQRGVVVGVAFGLACLTKLNAPFLVLPCVVLLLCERWRDFDVVNEGMPLLRFPRVPPAIWAMALLAPVLFVVLWPWLWHDTLARLGGYLAFHLKHYPIFLFYEGEIWNKPFAPASAVLTMAFITIPVVVVVLGLLGGISATVSLLRIVRTGGSALKDRVLALALLQAVFSVGVVAVSNVPRYGGEKLFMPFFPFFCVLAGQGIVVVVDALVALFGARFRALAVSVVVVVAVLPGFIGSARFFGGYALSYYGELTGGLRGAVSRGHERTYYDVADKDLARWLDRYSLERDSMERGARGRLVNFQPNHKEYVRTYRWLRTDGVISRGGVTLVDRLESADVVVLTHERRWSTYPALREQTRGWRLLHEKRIDGVPLYSVLQRP